MEPNITDVKFRPSAGADLNAIGEKDRRLLKEIVYRCWLLRLDPIPEEAEVVQSCIQKGYEIYRLKKVEFRAYRVLYAIDDEEGKIIVFGVMHRSVNYEGEYMERIIADYIACFGGDAHVAR